MPNLSRLSWPAVFLLFGALLPKPGWADEIVLVSPDYWCPFSCKAASTKEGFTVDIIREIFVNAGHTVRLVNENYSRALMDVRAGTFTATPSTFKDEAPDFVYPEMPISRNRYCFYVEPSSKWHYTNEASLEGRRTGIIQSYSYGAALDAAIKTRPKLFEAHTGDNLTERLIRRVDAGRIDSFVEEENLVNFTIKNMPTLAIRNAGCLKSSYAYMAISPAHPRAKEYAQLFSDGIVALKRSGRLKEILAEYGLNEWPLPASHRVVPGGGALSR